MMNEFELIRNLAGLENKVEKGNDKQNNSRSDVDETDPGIVVGIGDDAAVVRVAEGMDQVISCDTMVEGVHFHRWTMRYSDIGYKALAANISDMAAMGAVPKWFLVSASKPKTVSADRMREIYRGLYACAREYGVKIAGGDMTSSPQHLVLSVTIIGEVEKGRALLRSSARPGDIVFVTGPLGGAAAGLDYLLQKKQEQLSEDDLPHEEAAIVRKHRRPKPCVTEGRILSQFNQRVALNDISDGLASEANEIAEASGCGMIIYEKEIPILQEAEAYAQRTKGKIRDWVLFGGEEYTLLGTVPSSYFRQLKQLFDDQGLQIYAIGETTDDFHEVRLKQLDGNVIRLEPGGYRHF